MRLLIAALLLVAPSCAQQVDLSSDVRPTKQYVSYAAEPQVIAAGRRGTLDLRFRVNPGFHINSHTPRSELLIPTHLELDPAAKVKVDALDYPPGTAYSFSVEPSEKLDVYQDGFIVHVPVTAAAGEHELKGTLTYQACDKAACYPPRKLPVDVLFTAK